MHVQNTSFPLPLQILFELKSLKLKVIFLHITQSLELRCLNKIYIGQNLSSKLTQRAASFEKENSKQTEKKNLLFDVLFYSTVNQHYQDKLLSRVNCTIFVSSTQSDNYKAKAASLQTGLNLTMIFSITQRALFFNYFFLNLSSVNTLRWFYCHQQRIIMVGETTTNVFYFEMQLSSSSNICQVIA